MNFALIVLNVILLIVAFLAFKNNSLRERNVSIFSTVAMVLVELTFMGITIPTM